MEELVGDGEEVNIPLIILLFLLKEKVNKKFKTDLLS